ncbi:hypothetical protein ACTL6P_24165 [Endozoicomonas acroporae]|uniref:hypothetical protein n=1 Tax=Endozoicomonas acroporae TaxID=1701104 RepID=UPI000C767D62
MSAAYISHRQLRSPLKRLSHRFASKLPAPSKKYDSRIFFQQETVRRLFLPKVKNLWRAGLVANPPALGENAGFLTGTVYDSDHINPIPVL